jgi:hypothetical protein
MSGWLERVHAGERSVEKQLQLRVVNGIELEEIGYSEVVTQAMCDF